MVRELGRRLRTWDGLLLGILLVVVAFNAVATPGYLSVQNQINLFQLSVEKAIVVLAMTFVIVSAEIDLSVASVMGLAAVVVASSFIARTISPAIIFTISPESKSVATKPKCGDKTS